MLNFEEEVQKLQPTLEFEDVEKAVYKENSAELTEMVEEAEDLD